MTHISAPGRWTAERANGWYANLPWLVGANFVPSTASNQLEMWQVETFDAQVIERELGWAAELGMNTMRVFLHDLLWAEDADGFRERVDRYLDIAAGKGISTMLVLFDSVWNPDVALGPQPEPRPGVHNSQWVQGPGRALADRGQWGRLRDYVEGIVGAFADDERVLVWDVWNEPSNLNGGRFAEPDNKRELVSELLPQVFEWARAAGPSQPLTSGVWSGKTLYDDPHARIQIENSDVISFHDYQTPERFEAKLLDLPRDRPLFLTEFMARTPGSTFAGILPIAKREKIASYCWGLVAGRSQTLYPWDSWTVSYVDNPPHPWFHDVFHTDGTPYRADEVALVRQVMGRD
ncbi:cellulase family glycosylhydrolase [Devosia sp. XJ19-1]|uniref:Cellulase family glycosylhydrolase n=1 Tax=Devosia ureilytica TaxID=2952754 RepID=A0A9Q4ANE9_9HYPH|nr:cellulase family glycosylhydrolase [Devosia ureilytica]MCP8883796.1 cellulase family glycosylhydrolase [Devosia ureilytica]MCP8887404.1 cellulase family glycosylhydrolase [Devosia ureilytica]